LAVDVALRLILVLVVVFGEVTVGLTKDVELVFVIELITEVVLLLVIVFVAALAAEAEEAALAAEDAEAALAAASCWA